jgi:hypothetical protein
VNVLPSSDRRVVLWLMVAAICWRWLLAARTPLAGTASCHDLWLAQQLAGGDFVVLGLQWWAPLWSLLLAPAIAFGAPPLLAAQVAAALLGGLAIWPLAIAAERWRSGAGVSTAVLLMVAPGLAVDAGCGGAGNLLALLFGGIAVLGWRRRWPALLLAALALGALVDALRHGFGSWPAVGPGSGAIEPLIALLVGRGLAPWSPRLRELVSCAVVAGACYLGWQAVEPADAAIERWLGQRLARQLHPGQRISTDRLRVALAAGVRPLPLADADAVLADAAPAEVAYVVLGQPLARRSSLTAVLAGTFARHQLPNDAVDPVEARGLLVLIRR